MISLLLDGFQKFRQTLIMTAVAVGMFGLLGAGSCSEKEEPVSEIPTITFWHFGSDPVHRAAVHAIVANFERANNCKVQVTELNWGDGKTKLFVAFNSNTAPDVLELGSDWIAQFSHKGVLRNLSKDGITLNRFAPFTVEAATYNGSVFALPWTVDTRVLFYNKAILRKAGLSDAPPKTFNELYLACEKIRSLGTDSLGRGDVYGFGVNGSDEHRLYKKALSFFWSAGGDVLDASGKLVLNSPQNIAALNAYISLARCGFVETQRQLDDMFVRGTVGFVISGSWLLDKIEKENKALDFGVAVVPAIATSTSMANNTGVSWAGAEYLSINAKSQNAALAKKFIAYMTDGKTALGFCKTSNETGFPADKQYMSNDFFATYPHRMVFAQQLASAKMTPIHPQWLDIEKIIEEACVEALIGRRTAQDALNLAQVHISDLLTKRTQ